MNQSALERARSSTAVVQRQLEAQKYRDEFLRSEDLAAELNQSPEQFGDFYRFLYQDLDTYHEILRPQPHGNELCPFVESLVPDWEFKSGKQTFGMVLVPRGCAKTSIITKGFSLYGLTQNPNLRVLISGHRHDAAKEILSTTKWEVERERFMERYGKWRPQFKEAKWAEDAVVITPRTKGYREASIDTAGVDRSKIGGHYDLIIIDDLINENNMYSSVMRRRALDHIMSMYPILEPHGTLIIVATRMHVADYCAELLRLDDLAQRDGRERKYKTLIRSCYIDGDGGEKKLYYPLRLGHEFLEDQKYSLTAKKYAAWYLNQPIDDASKVFRREWLRYADFTYATMQDVQLASLSSGARIPVYTTLTWDPAGRKPSETSAYHGITVIGCDAEKTWWAFEIEQVKGTASDIVQHIADLVYLYGVKTMAIEGGLLELWLDLLEPILQGRGFMPHIHSLRPPPGEGSKLMRIENILQPRIKAGKLMLRAGRAGVVHQDFLDQLDEFPESDFFDMLDALAIQNQVARVPLTSALQSGFESEEDLLDEEGEAALANLRRSGAWVGRGTPTRLTSGRYVQ